MLEGTLSNYSQNENQKAKLKPTELFTLELSIVEIEILLKKYDSSDKMLKDLSRRHVLLPDRARIIIVESKLFCVKGDFDGALERLKLITMENGLEHFIKSRQIMASIYLTRFKQFTHFIGCYQ